MCPDHNSLDYRHTAYTISASKLNQCPEDSLREVAFIGRSNAGKSSAINTLTRQKSLARTSKTPGRTQLLNFFQIEPQIYLVDLPGFGYAKVPEAMKLKWQKELENYMQKRDVLQGLVLLMDIRHPLKDTELQIIKWAGQSEMPLHILLTKSDKLKRGAAKTALLTTRKQLSDYTGALSIQLFSALNGDGVRELSKKMDQWLCPDETGIDPVESSEVPDEETLR